MASERGEVTATMGHFYFSQKQKRVILAQGDPTNACMIPGVGHVQEYTEMIRAANDGTIPKPTGRWDDYQYLGHGSVA